MNLVEPAALPADLMDCIAALPENLFLGTSSWSFPGWQGLVYAREYKKSTLARHGLSAYSRHPLFKSVGIDRSYYSPLPSSDFQSYAEAVPADFRFLAKAHDWCTLPYFPKHPRYGARAGESNPEFLNSSYAIREIVVPMQEGLRAKAGVLLFQFSPLPADRYAGDQDFESRLERFLAAIRGTAGDLVLAVELRTPGLLSARYAAVLREFGAVHCFNIHPSMPPLAEQMKVVPPAPPALVIRWMQSLPVAYGDAVERYRPFNRLVDARPDQRSQVVRLLKKFPETPRYLIANNKAEGSAPLTLLEVARKLLR